MILLFSVFLLFLLLYYHNFRISFSSIKIEQVQIRKSNCLSSKHNRPTLRKGIQLTTEIIKQLHCSWNYNMWIKTPCSYVTSIKTFPWERLSLSISSMIIIMGWLTWNKMAFNPKHKHTPGVSYHIAQLNTIYVTSPLYHLKFIFQSLITLHMNHTLDSRCNNTHQFHNKQFKELCNNYTKTQAYK